MKHTLSLAAAALVLLALAGCSPDNEELLTWMQEERVLEIRRLPGRHHLLEVRRDRVPDLRPHLAGGPAER